MTRFRFDPLCGKIPLRLRELCDPNGREFDPNYEPLLPPGAIRGDIRKQNYCCEVPRYFYLDEKRECIQCGRPFTFGAAEQKFWYESLGFHARSTAIRCRQCRRKQRSEKALRAEIAATRSGTQTNPTDAAG